MCCSVCRTQVPLLHQRKSVVRIYRFSDTGIPYKKSFCATSPVAATCACVAECVNRNRPTLRRVPPSRAAALFGVLSCVCVWRRGRGGVSCDPKPRARPTHTLHGASTCERIMPFWQRARQCGRENERNRAAHTTSLNLTSILFGTTRRCSPHTSPPKKHWFFSPSQALRQRQLGHGQGKKGAVMSGITSPHCREEHHDRVARKASQRRCRCTAAEKAQAGTSTKLLWSARRVAADSY